MNITTKLNGVKGVVTSKAGRQILLARKSSPTLLFGVGTVGFVATTVLAGRATLKASEVLRQAKGDLTDIQIVLDTTTTGYSERDAVRDKAVVYARTGVEFSKLYGPAVTVGALSLGAFSGSHIILTRRNAGLVAAYAAAEKGFAEYRERVVDAIGADRERELRTVKDSEEVHDTKKGVVRKEDVVTGKPGSMYAQFFDRDSSSSWSPEPSYNFVFLKCQQTFANQLLQSRGHVFLNDVHDALGLERTSAGQVVGWVKGNGDDYIDFGIFNGENMDSFHDFITGREGGIWLDFNVDGVVYDKI